MSRFFLPNMRIFPKHRAPLHFLCALALILPPRAAQADQKIDDALKLATGFLVSQQKPLHIYIKADPQARSLKVSNPIQAKQNTEESSGTGLKNIADRYKYAVGKPIGIQHSKDQFEVVIPLI